jgi:hypothetical protein
MSIAFNEEYYLANNPDVAAAIDAGLFQSAEEHFNLFGWSEGRWTCHAFVPPLVLV